MRPAQRLEEMVMGIDQAWYDRMPARIEDLVHVLGRLLAGSNQLDDPAALDDNPAAGILRQNGQRIPYPQTHALLPRNPFPAKLAPVSFALQQIILAPALKA